ncbi:MAG: glycosyltransferase [Thermofilum sp.]|jgi:glycosyltransferase involved in cell wall biosynthesis|nr:glycosyltransferase [Thermofilum sp.]
MGERVNSLRPKIVIVSTFYLPIPEAVWRRLDHFAESLSLKLATAKYPGKYALFNLQFPKRSVKLMLVRFITCDPSSLRFAYSSREAATRAPSATLTRWLRGFLKSSKTPGLSQASSTKVVQGKPLKQVALKETKVADANPVNYQMREGVNCIYAVVPSLFGSKGDAVNERQFITTLAEVANVNVKVFTFISLLQAIRERRYLKQQINELAKRGVTVVPLLMFPYLTTFYSLIIFLLISFYLWMKIKLGVKVLIYIRTSNLALGFVEIPEVAKRCIVKIPAIIEDENLHISIIERKLFDAFDRKVATKAGVLAFPTPLLYVVFLRRRRLKPKGCIVYLPPGINSARIKLLKRNVDADKLKLRICFIGYLEWWQGVDILVRSIAILMKELPELQDKIKLEIIGNGPQRVLIEYLCRAYRVRCEITGYLSHEEALKKLSGCTLLVLPRRRSDTTESVVPIKVIESWALGVPVVVTGHEVFRLLNLKDREDIVYCEPTPESVAAALAEVLTSEELRKKLSERGPQIASYFDYKNIIEKLFKIMSTCQNANKH